jgi:putative peptide zinc metalloprotease protein
VSEVLPPDAELRVRPLSIVPERDEFVVGDPERGEFVVLPAIGVEVIRLLAKGCTIGEVAANVGPDVDVADFIQTLIELNFVVEASSDMTPGDSSRRWRISPTLVQPLVHPVARFGYTACALVAATIMVTRADLIPHPSDFFFVDSPLVSLACVTLIAYVLGAAHELAHWTAARAAGIDARVTVSRRLYFLTFETDLSRLWSLPRRRRYGALLAGMAFDVVVLAAVLIARLGAQDGWLPLGPVAFRLLGAVALVQLTAVASQLFIFARTDLYAVLVVVTGCINLWRVNRLRLIARIRSLSDTERTELADAHPRDVQVARWYAWLYVFGMAFAGGYFVMYFLPTSVRLVSWLWTTITAAQLGGWEFWSALILGGVVISPHALSLFLATRQLVQRWSHSAGAPRDPVPAFYSTAQRFCDDDSTRIQSR